MSVADGVLPPPSPSVYEAVEKALNSRRATSAVNQVSRAFEEAKALAREASRYSRSGKCTLKGLRPCDILKRVPRSRPWLLKWQKHFAGGRSAGLAEQSRRPQQSPRRYDDRTRAMVIRLRQVLEKCPIGLIGARQVRREIQQQQRLVPTVRG